MSDQVSDVTRPYLAAARAAEKYKPGDQSDIAALMKSAFVHGYAQALMDFANKPGVTDAPTK